ncbi:MAG: hypothetical protein BGO49_24295 [Planctomycetales bacterium 71-10]|nr:MAG: hypothetical protein BGO49_24295 [Planctomycetales bacterium 71-10]
MLSDTALIGFRLFVERNGDMPVVNSNREAFRELVREGVMIAGHSFAGGRESFYALTEAGKRMAVMLECGTLA